MLKRIEVLERENAELKRMLGMAVEAVPADEELTPSKAIEAVIVQPKPVLRDGFDKYRSPEEKIALFRSLFRGREDVFAARWQSVTTGKSGYSPACANEWAAGVCAKPKGSCQNCEHRELLSLTDAVIYRHLRGNDAYGRDIVGIYPILPDDTCFFLALDFDDEGWSENVSAVRDICKEWDVPCAVERSRSGEGAHQWLFFENAVPCAEARRLGTALLTAAMEKGGELKLKAYDRMFPNQDVLPKGGFGNLIALPLQGLARRKGNSVFVDESFEPYPDQWKYLASVHFYSPIPKKRRPVRSRREPDRPSCRLQKSRFLQSPVLASAGL